LLAAREIIAWRIPAATIRVGYWVSMPLYEYKCGSCGEVLEVRQKFSDEPLTIHDKCGGSLEKLISRSSLQFKGTGWYVTDYAKGNGKKPAKDSQAESSGDKSSGDQKSEASAGKSSTKDSTSQSDKNSTSKSEKSDKSNKPKADKPKASQPSSSSATPASEKNPGSSEKR